jgi:RNA polymerase sigma factor (sigma-70 family)
MSPSRDAEIEAVLARLGADRGDEAAWRRFYDLLWAYLFSSATRATQGDTAEGEEVAQEAIVRLLRYCDFNRFPSAGGFRAYARRVVENIVRSRRGGALLRLDSAELVEDLTAAPVELEDLLGAQWLEEALLSKLDAADHALLRYMIEGYSLAEISTAMGERYGTIGVRVHRLRMRIRKLLKEKGLEDPPQAV